MPHISRLRTLATLAVLVSILSFSMAPGWKIASAQDDDVAPVENGASQVTVTLTGDEGGTCLLDYTSAAAGPVTFTVTNESATSLIEVELLSNNRILGEKENLAPGLPPVSFTVTLGGGDYQIYCPGAATEMIDFTATGEVTEATGTIAEILAEGTVGYGAYVDGVVDNMVVAVGTLDDAIQAGDLEAAKVAYANARPFYERIESSVEGFIIPGFDATDNHGNLDYLIDMRESNLDPDVGWHGFHAIERDLFEAGAITDNTKQLSTELVENVDLLLSVVKGLEYAPEDLANGAASLLEEVQANKVSGEEENYSHIDLVDFAGNVEGAEQAFAFLEPGLTEIDPDLTAQIRAQFDAVKALLETYRDPDELGGYTLYTEALKASDAATLSRAIQALQEPLSQIAEKVATAG